MSSLVVAARSGGEVPSGLRSRAGATKVAMKVDIEFNADFEAGARNGVSRHIFGVFFVHWQQIRAGSWDSTLSIGLFVRHWIE